MLVNAYYEQHAVTRLYVKLDTESRYDCSGTTPISAVGLQTTTSKIFMVCWRDRILSWLLTHLDVSLYNTKARRLLEP
jgi:hypothetical protein